MENKPLKTRRVLGLELSCLAFTGILLAQPKPANAYINNYWHVQALEHMADCEESGDTWGYNYWSFIFQHT